MLRVPHRFTLTRTLLGGGGGGSGAQPLCCRHFVTHAQPASFIDREFVLMTTFPNRVIENEDLSIEDAKLCNAAVVQKWK